MSDNKKGYGLFHVKLEGRYYRDPTGDPQEGVMTRAELVVFLDGLDFRDSEVSHKYADDAVVNFLVDEGYPEVAAAYHRASERAKFRYS